MTESGLTLERSEALALIEGLERAARHHRPLLLFGLIAVIAGFVTISVYLYLDRQEQKHRADALAVEVDALQQTLGRARQLAANPHADPQAHDRLRTLLGAAVVQADTLKTTVEQIQEDHPARPAAPPPTRRPQSAAASATPPVPQRTSLPTVETAVRGGGRAVRGAREINRIIVLDAQQLDLQRELRGLEMSGASYHYLIDREGGIHRLKDENDVAYHSGPANRDSIGIGLLHVSGSGEYSPAQLASLTELIREIAARRGIARSQVFTGAEVNRRRRSDFGAVRDAVLEAAF